MRPNVAEFNFAEMDFRPKIPRNTWCQITIQVYLMSSRFLSQAADQGKAMVIELLQNLKQSVHPAY